MVVCFVCWFRAVFGWCGVALLLGGVFPLSPSPPPAPLVVPLRLSGPVDLFAGPSLRVSCCILRRPGCHSPADWSVVAPRFRSSLRLLATKASGPCVGYTMFAGDVLVLGRSFTEVFSFGRSGNPPWTPLKLLVPPSQPLLLSRFLSSAAVPGSLSLSLSCCLACSFCSLPLLWFVLVDL